MCQSFELAFETPQTYLQLQMQENMTAKQIEPTLCCQDFPCHLVNSLKTRGRWEC